MKLGGGLYVYSQRGLAKQGNGTHKGHVHGSVGVVVIVVCIVIGLVVVVALVAPPVVAETEDATDVELKGLAPAPAAGALLLATATEFHATAGPAVFAHGLLNEKGNCLAARDEGVRGEDIEGGETAACECEWRCAVIEEKGNEGGRREETGMVEGGPPGWRR